MPSQPSYPAYGVSGGDPYGSYVGGYGGGSGYEQVSSYVKSFPFSNKYQLDFKKYKSCIMNASLQPVIYGRGPMPAGMRMVPMVLPDGRLGYVL